MLLFFVALSMLFPCPDVYTRHDSRRTSGKGSWATANIQILDIYKGQLLFQVLRIDSLYHFITGPHAVAEFALWLKIYSVIMIIFLLCEPKPEFLCFSDLILVAQGRKCIQASSLDTSFGCSGRYNLSRRVNNSPGAVISVLINNQFN